jgi:hypothetical protein
MIYRLLLRRQLTVKLSSSEKHSDKKERHICEVEITSVENRNDNDVTVDK